MHSPHIVVVEDEPAIRRGVVDALRLSGYDVTEAADGATGFEHSSRPGVRLVLLDLLLPRRDGLDVLAELRSASDIVLALTAKHRRGAGQVRCQGLRRRTSHLPWSRRQASPCIQDSAPSRTKLARKSWQVSPSWLKAEAIGVIVPRAPVAGFSQGTAVSLPALESASLTAARAMTRSPSGGNGSAASLAARGRTEPVMSRSPLAAPRRLSS